MSFSINLPQEVSPGSVLVALVGVADSTASAEVNFVSQVGATWEFVEASIIQFTRAEIWICRNAFGADLQIDFNTTADESEEGVVLEVSNVFDVGGTIVDRIGHETSTSTTPNSGNTLQTTDSNELWMAVLAVRGGDTVSNPQGGYSILTQLSTGLSGSDITLAVLDQIAATQGDAIATVDSDAGSVDFAGAVATFFGTPPPYHLSITGISPTEIPENGGYLLSIVGDFSGELGSLFEVFVGPNGDSSDPQCFSGVAGRPGTVYPVNETELRCYTPRLDQGLSHVFVRKEGGSRFGLIANILLVLPRSFRTNVFDVRKILPPHWRKGPLTIEEEF